MYPDIAARKRGGQVGRILTTKGIPSREYNCDGYIFERKLLTTYFPEIAEAVGGQVSAGSVLDGELVAYREGRCDFLALQRRITGRWSTGCCGGPGPGLPGVTSGNWKTVYSRHR